MSTLQDILNISTELSQFSHGNGGRKVALAILADMKKFAAYEELHDVPSQSATSGLSPHNKFGTCSIREVHHAVSFSLGENHPLIRQLYWRDFYYHIAHHFPHVFGHAFHKKYDALPWENDPEKFQALCDGLTGFPIVDAGMRQLNQTGYMHNRARLIAASFLVKDLHIDWQWGERYFAQKLIDYDPCINNGNWQWVASTGCDAQPYFRIFNPWLQQKKFDRDCLYIYKWIPELRDQSPATIHNPHKLLSVGTYPVRIVDHVTRSRQMKDFYQRL